MRLSLPTGLVIVLLLLVAAWGFRLHVLVSGVAIVCALAVFCMFVIKTSGRTFWQWRQLARHRKYTSREDALVFSMDGKAVTWDGNRISMFLELHHSPFHLVSTKGKLKSPDLPVDIIADALRQYDITLDHIAVVSHGCRVVSPTAYNKVFFKGADHGLFPRLRTLIRISVRLSTSLNAIDSRRGEGEGPEVGAARVVDLATQRLMRSLIDAGWSAKPVSKTQLEQLDMEISQRIGDGLQNETVRGLMGENVTQVYASKSIHFDLHEVSQTADSYTFYRVIRPEGKTQVLVDTYLMLTGGDDEDTWAGKGGWVLDKGVQGDLVSQILPTAPYVDTLRKYTASFSHPAKMPEISQQAVGAGVYIGSRYKRKTEHMYLSLTGARGKVLYVNASANFLRSFIARSTAIGEGVDILLPDPEGVWKQWAAKLNTPDLISVSQMDTGKSMRIVSGDTGVVPVDSAVTIAVCVNGIPKTARYILSNVGESVYNVRTAEDGVASVTWVASRDELSWFKS